ncbi:unnamed protein product, partial [Prorocentrum cordatum]
TFRPSASTRRCVGRASWGLRARTMTPTSGAPSPGATAQAGRRHGARSTTMQLKARRPTKRAACAAGAARETPRLLWPSATPCVPRRWTPARPWRTRRAVQTPRRARCAAPRSSPHSRRRSPTRRWRSRRPRPRRPASRGSGPPPRRPAAAPPQGLGASGPAWPDCGTAPGEMRASRLPHAGAERCSRPHAESLTPSARR